MKLAHLDATDALARLLAAVPAGQRAEVRVTLLDPHRGGHGLRSLLAMLEADGRPLPAELPGELVSVYLTDDAAEPLHDCGRCGLPVPVRAGRHVGHEAAVERDYFPSCPCCGGQTGRHAYWSARPGHN